MDFEEWKGALLSYLQEKIKNNQINYEEFKKAVDEYRKLGFDIEKILEVAAKNSNGEQKEKIWNLYNDFSRKNIAEINDSLNKLGYKLRKNKEYQNVVATIQDQSFRIMEKVRHALRSEVEYMLMRIFIANKKEIPIQLAKSFNPIYPDEIFKTFIYSFLGGILGETEEI